jgi:hypothetical protein
MTACRRGRSRVLPRVIAPVLLVVAMTTACESEQAGPQVPTAPSTADVRPALLDAAWTAPAPAGAQVAGRLRAWTTKDRVTVVGKQQIRSYDLASGKAAWTAALPRGTTGVCTISENAGDIGALLLRTKTGCTDVAALSLADGSWRWRHAIEPLAKGTPSVSLSRLAVAATGKCRQVIRFGVAEGRRLKPVAPRTRCARTPAPWRATRSRSSSMRARTSARSATNSSAPTREGDLPGPEQRRSDVEVADLGGSGRRQRRRSGGAAAARTRHLAQGAPDVARLRCQGHSGPLRRVVAAQPGLRPPGSCERGAARWVTARQIRGATRTP